MTSALTLWFWPYSDLYVLCEPILTIAWAGLLPVRGVP
jgi:hypothetical protein